MGGLGSGRHFRIESTKDTVEDCVTLNIFKLVQEGFIIWDRPCTGTFTSGSCSMRFQLVENSLRLMYRVKSTGRELDYRIPLTRTYPHFGGYRLWFCCPRCNLRVGKLYLAPGQIYYLCRKCANLTYQSTREMSLSKAMKILQTPVGSEEMSLPEAMNILKATTRRMRATAKYIR